MPLDTSRIQGFGSTPEPEKERSSSFGGIFDSLRDQASGPAMRSAFDSFSLRIGDALEAAQEDVSEMAFEFKSFVSGATGMPPPAGPKDDEPSEPAVQEKQRAEVMLSPRQKAEAIALMSKFCGNYGAARVAPRPAELEDLWMRCSILQPNSVASAIYEQLSFSNGDLEWQPRLRILYLLEHFYWKGGLGKDIGTGILNHGAGLLQHLATEVPQTKEKAEQVIQVLNGSAEPPPRSKDEAPVAEKKAAEAERRPEPQSDLLDLAAPASPAAASSAPAGPVDLLSAQAGPAVPPVVDLISIMSTPAPAPAQSSSSVASAAPSPLLGFDPNPQPAGGLASSSWPSSTGPSSVPWTAFPSQPQNSLAMSTGLPFSPQQLHNVSASAAPMGVTSVRDARAGYGQMAQPKAMQQQLPASRKYIPSPAELPPPERQVDPFAWAEDITKTALPSA